VGESVLAATKTGKLHTELREYALPDIDDDAGLLQVEATGVCGSDWHLYQREDTTPLILGHETIGVIARLGSSAARRWGVKEGDRVAVEEYLPCGHCALCRSGDFRLCDATQLGRPGALRYGATPVTVPPALWGGYSQYLYLHPNAVLHRLPTHLAPELATMFIPVSNGIQWACFDGGVGPGMSVLIEGPGQQGLAACLAAKQAGAACVIVSGLSRDAHRLAVARLFGADYTVDVEHEDVRQRVQDVTGGRGVDVVVDTAGAPDSLATAMHCVRKGGTIVVATVHGRQSPMLRLEDLVAKRLTLKGLRGHSYQAVELAIQYLASGRYPFAKMATHRLTLPEVDLAIRSVGGVGLPSAIHVTVVATT
jgi:threonine dehydrogenase-like Zn-dependent dehydrogenase